MVDEEMKGFKMYFITYLYQSSLDHSADIPSPLWNIWVVVVQVWREGQPERLESLWGDKATAAVNTFTDTQLKLDLTVVVHLLNHIAMKATQDN